MDSSKLLSLLLLLCYSKGSFSLRCLQCYSRQTWEDCNNNAIEMECKYSEDVCFMAHRVTQRAQQQRHEFIKACYDPSWCKDEDCRKSKQRHIAGSWCETRCCKNKDLCNVGVTLSWEIAVGGKAHEPESRFLIGGLTPAVVAFVLS